MNFLWLWAFAVLQIANAEPCAQPTTRLLQGKSEALCRAFGHEGSWISARCVLGACQALTAKAGAKAALVKGFSGPGAPNAQICERLGGKVLIALSPGHDEECFCSFSDHSLISCTELVR